MLLQLTLVEPEELRMAFSSGRWWGDREGESLLEEDGKYRLKQEPRAGTLPWPEYQWWKLRAAQRRLKDSSRPHWLERRELLTQASTRKPGLLRLNLCRMEATDERSSEPAAKQGLTSSFHGDVVCTGESE